MSRSESGLISLQKDRNIGNCIIKILDAVYDSCVGQSLPEHELFAAGDGMFLLYGRKKHPEGDVPHFIGFAADRFLYRASVRLGLETIPVPDPSDPDEARTILRDWLSQGWLGAVLVNEADIPGHVVADLTGQDGIRITDRNHYVVPVGYESATETVVLWVAEAHANSYKSIRLVDLATAWYRMALQFPNTSVAWTGKIEPSMERQQLYCVSLRTMASMLLGMSPVDRIPVYRWFKPEAYGIAALRLMAEEIPLWPEKIQPKSRFGQVLTGMILYKDDSGYCFTQVARLLDSASKVFGRMELAEAAERFQFQSQQWTIISNLLFKVGYTGEQFGILERVSDRLKRMADDLTLIANTIFEVIN